MTTAHGLLADEAETTVTWFERGEALRAGVLDCTEPLRVAVRWANSPHRPSMEGGAVGIISGMVKASLLRRVLGRVFGGRRV